MGRFQSVSKVGLFGVIGNIFLMLIKMGSGILFSSQAMIADAVNSLMDIFASLMTLLGGKIGSRPRDTDHQFGHGKAEFIFSLFVSLSMIGGAFYIFWDSLRGAIYGHVIDFSFILVVVCIITIFVKFGLYLFSRQVYQSTKSLLVYSNMIDHRNDMIITSFTFLSIFSSIFGFFLLDSLVGVGISLWIFYSGVRIFFDSYHVLMDQAMDENQAKAIQDFILKQKGIEGITKFETVPAGYQYILILSILVDGNLTTFKSHKIADQLEKGILEQFSDILTVTIHVNPIRKRKQQKKIIV